MRGFLENPAELKYLRHIKAPAITVAAQNILQAIKDTPDQKTILCIGTGGTLSMSEDANGIRKPSLSADQLMAHLSAHVTAPFNILTLDAFHLDSAQMDYSHVQDLAIALSYIWSHIQAAHAQFAGFIILHGTDTLSYAGATMSLMMGQGLPFSIVYTAAQKPMTAPLSDGPMNVQNAILTLDALHSADMAEVVSVMGDFAYLSSSAIKIDDSHQNALIAPLHEPVTRFDTLEHPLQLAPWLNPRRKMNFQPTIWQDKNFHTALIRSHMGLDGEFIARQIADPHIKSVLLYSYGAGTLNDQIIAAATKAAKAKGAPIFVLSPVDTPYKVLYASAQSAMDQGITPLFMTLPAALTKIEIALRLYEADNKAIAAFMTGNYVGEIPAHAL